MAAINSIQPLWDSLFTEQAGMQDANQVQEGMPIFEDVFRDMLDTVKQTDAEKNEAEYLLATGQLDNPSVRSIARATALLSVQLPAALPNRALAAYRGISRMTI